VTTSSDTRRSLVARSRQHLGRSIYLPATAATRTTTLTYGQVPIQRWAFQREAFERILCVLPVFIYENVAQALARVFSATQLNSISSRPGFDYPFS